MTVAVASTSELHASECEQPVGLLGCAEVGLEPHGSALVLPHKEQVLCNFARPIRLRFGLRFDSIRFDSIRFGASGDVGGAPEAWETWDYATWGRCLEAGERCPYIILITKEVVLSRKRVSLGVGVIGTGVSLQTTGASRVLLRIGVCRATREHRFLELYTGSLNRGNPHGSPPGKGF